MSSTKADTSGFRKISTNCWSKACSFSKDPITSTRHVASGGRFHTACGRYKCSSGPAVIHGFKCGRWKPVLICYSQKSLWFCNTDQDNFPRATHLHTYLAVWLRFWSCACWRFPWGAILLFPFFLPLLFILSTNIVEKEGKTQTWIYSH